MARKRKANIPMTTDEDGGVKIDRIPFGRNVQWVSANLNADDKAWLAANRGDSVAHVGELLEELPPSFNLSIKFDDKGGRYNAVLVCTDKNHPAANCALSLRARTAFDALYAMAYWTGERSIEPWWDGIAADDDDPWG